MTAAWWNRPLAWAIAFVAGAFYGAAGSFGHAIMLGWFPAGLVLGLVGGSALMLAIRLLVGDRWAALAAGLGIMLATWVFSLPSPGGSAVFLQANEVLASVWMLGIPLVAALVVAWPRLTRPPRAPAVP